MKKHIWKGKKKKGSQPGSVGSPRSRVNSEGFAGFLLAPILWLTRTKPAIRSTHRVGPILIIMVDLPFKWLYIYWTIKTLIIRNTSYYLILNFKILTLNKYTTSNYLTWKLKLKKFYLYKRKIKQFNPCNLWNSIATMDLKYIVIETMNIKI